MKWIGIRLGLTLVFSGLILALLIPLSFFLYRDQQAASLKQLQDSLFLEGALLRRVLDSEIVQNDPNMQKQIFDFGTALPYRITLIDSQGVVKADTLEDPVRMENHSDRPEVQAALNGKQLSLIHDSETLHEPMLYAALPLDENNPGAGVIRIASSLSEVDKVLRKQRDTLIGSIFFCFLLAMALSFWLARWLTRPLEEMTHVAKGIISGDLSLRSSVRRQDEIGILAHTLNRLTANLEKQIHTLTEERLKFKLILEQLEDPVILLNRQGQIVEVNSAAYKLFSGKSLIGEHHLDVIGDSLLEEALRVSWANRSSQTTLLHLNKATNRRVFQSFITPLSSEFGGYGQDQILLVLHDITTLQTLYEQQTEFVANASHELATPLSAIQGFSETLLDDTVTDRATQKKFLGIIHNESERMTRLLRDLLQLARLESTEYLKNFPLQNFNFSLLLQESILEIRASAESKLLDLTLDLPPNLPAIYGNPDWLKQVLINLLSNAIKYTPEKGSVHVKSWIEENTVHLTISDTGIGIPADDLPKLFQRFFRVNRDRSRQAGGTGIGLAIVKHVVRLHQGQIYVTSELGKGSTFHIELPIQEKKSL